jgi:hypothetical protein
MQLFPDCCQIKRANYDIISYFKLIVNKFFVKLYVTILRQYFWLYLKALILLINL